MPPLTPERPDYRQPAPAVGPKRGDVALLYGCVQDAFLAGVNAATVRVLQRNGYEVHFPPQQTCCGAAPLHIGEQRRDARTGAAQHRRLRRPRLCGRHLQRGRLRRNAQTVRPSARRRPALCGEGARVCRQTQGHQRVSGRKPAHAAHRRSAPAPSLMSIPATCATPKKSCASRANCSRRSPACN